jgi:hypothetical protein
MRKTGQAGLRVATEETGAVQLPGKGLSRDHGTALRAHKNALKALDTAKATKDAEKIKAAKNVVAATRNDELFTRMRATSEAVPHPPEHPHFEGRRQLAKGLLKKYATRSGALAKGMRSVPGIERTMAFLDELATKGEHGRMWYEDSADAIKQIARGDKDRAEKIAQLVAIYSPRQPILGNTSMAFRAYNDSLLPGGKVTVGKAWQRTAAEKVMKGEADYEGRKVNNFYVNFLEDIDKTKYDDLVKRGELTGKEVTSDSWMSRAFGHADDSMPEGRYDVIEQAVRHLAEERGWKPKQVQAAIWTAIKDASTDTSANIDFVSGIGRHLGQINYEAAITSSLDPELRAMYQSWPRPVQEGFLRAKAAPTDRFMVDVGLLSHPTEYGPGVYGDIVSPGARARVGISAAPREAGGYTVTENERALLNATSAAIARVLKQDSVAWMRPFVPRSKGVVDTFEVQLGRQATDDEAIQLWQTLNPGGEERFIVVHSDEGLFVRNITEEDAPNYVQNYISASSTDDFEHLTHDAIATVFPEKPPTVGYVTDGELVEGKNYGQEFMGAFGDAEGSGQGLRFQQAVDRYSREAEAVDRAFAADPARAAAEYGVPRGGVRRAVGRAASRVAREERGSIRFGYGREPPPLEEVPKTPGEQVFEAMPQAKRQRRLQEKGYSEEWGRRVAAGAEKLETMGGTPEAFEAAINELRGELPKLRYDKLRKLDQAAVEDLTKQISEHPDLRFFERIRTYKALHAALEGRVPQRNQIALLEKVFGPDVTETIKDAASLGQRAKALGIEIWNMPRALASSFDLSAPFRQALVIGGGHPITFFKNFTPMVKAAGSERYYDEVMREITEDVNYGRMEIGGLDLTDLENIVTREESRKGGQLAENIESRLTAGKLRPVRASGRAYTAFLNKMRADVFNQILATAEKAGRDIDDPEFLKQVGSLLNAASGRGNLLGLEKHATLLNSIFFSPKLAASRVEMLARTANLANPRSTIDPILKRETAKMMAGVTTFVGGLLGLVELSGAGTVNFNPTNADFLKIKIGDTRIDPLGGFQQYIRLAAQLKRGEITYSGTDETVPKSQLASLKRFGRGKVSPQMGATLDILAHQKFPERTPINTWGQRAITAVQAGAPLTPADVVKYAKHTHDPLGTAGIALANTLGISTQTYPPHDAAADLRKRAKQFAGREPDPRAVKEAEEKSVLDAKLTNVDNYKDRLQITADYLSDLGDDSGQRYVRHARSERSATRYYHHLRDKMFRHLERENRHLNHLEDRAVERNGSH